MEYKIDPKEQARLVNYISLTIPFQAAVDSPMGGMKLLPAQPGLSKLEVVAFELFKERYKVFLQFSKGQDDTGMVIKQEYNLIID